MSQRALQCCCLDERTHYLYLGAKHWITNEGEVIQIINFLSSCTRYLQHVCFTFQYGILSDLPVIFKTGKSFLNFLVLCLDCMFIFDKYKIYFKVNSRFSIRCRLYADLKCSQYCYFDNIAITKLMR